MEGNFKELISKLEVSIGKLSNDKDLDTELKSELQYLVTLIMVPDQLGVGSTCGVSKHTWERFTSLQVSLRKSSLSMFQKENISSDHIHSGSHRQMQEVWRSIESLLEHQVKPDPVAELRAELKMLRSLAVMGYPAAWSDVRRWDFIDSITEDANILMACTESESETESDPDSEPDSEWEWDDYGVGSGGPQWVAASEEPIEDEDTTSIYLLAAEYNILIKLRDIGFGAQEVLQRIERIMEIYDHEIPGSKAALSSIPEESSQDRTIVINGLPSPAVTTVKDITAARQKQEVVGPKRVRVPDKVSVHSPPQAN